MMIYSDVEHIKQKTLKNVDEKLSDWMRSHTIQDMRDIVFELYNRGEDISEMVDLIHDMDEIAVHAHVGDEESISAIAEYDILTYVEEVEHALA